MELSSALSRLVLPSAVDLKGLCALRGRYAWRLCIDLTVLACDGSPLDACAAAVRAALGGTALPDVTCVERSSDENIPGTPAASARTARDELAVDGDYANARPPPGCDGCPVVVTIFVVETESSGGGSAGGARKPGRALIVDARSEEESSSVCRLALSVDRGGRICGAYKYGSSASSLRAGGGVGGTVSPGLLREASEMAVRCSRDVFDVLDRAVVGGSGYGILQSRPIVR